MGSRENRRNALGSRCKAHFFQGTQDKSRNWSIVRLAATEATPTARRLTCSSGDQSLVENAKTEITRVEKQMRRFSRWLLRRRRAMWLEELEEGIRRTSPRWHRHRVETPSFWTNSSPHPALHEYTWNDFRREHLELQDPGDSETTTLHREEARADYARNVKQLRRAPARRSRPPWSIPGRLWLLLMWPTFLRKGKRRFDALGYKPLAGSQLLETRHAITSCPEATRRCDAAPVVSSRSLGWVIPKPGSRVAWYTACVIF